MKSPRELSSTRRLDAFEPLDALGNWEHARPSNIRQSLDAMRGLTCRLGMVSKVD